MARRRKKTVTQALNQLDRMAMRYKDNPFSGGGRKALLDDIYGVLEESLSEDKASPNEDWKKAYNRNSFYGSGDRIGLGSNGNRLNDFVRVRQNRNTASKGNSNT